MPNCPFSLEPYALTTPERMRCGANLSQATFPDGILIPKINAVSRQFEEICCRPFGFRRYASYPVNVTFGTTQGMSIGATTILISGGGAYMVAAINGNQATLYNLGSDGNAGPGATINSGSAVTCLQTLTVGIGSQVNTVTVGDFVQPAASNWLNLCGNGLDRIWVPRRPIKALTYVAIVDWVVGNNGGLPAIGVNTVAPAYSYSTTQAIFSSDQVFRLSPETDREGMLLRPLRWPAWLPSHHDVTRNANWGTSLKGYNIQIQGDFGFILPQYACPVDGVIPSTQQNPNGLPTDIDPDLEALVWQEAEERCKKRPRPGFKGETSAGGVRQDYQDPTYLAQRESFLRYQLQNWMNAQAVLP